MKFDDMWAECEKPLENLINGKGISKDIYMSFYERIHEVCSSQNEYVFKSLLPRISSFVSSSVMAIMRSFDHISDEDLTVFFGDQWKAWKKHCRTMSNLFQPVILETIDCYVELEFVNNKKVMDFYAHFEQQFLEETKLLYSKESREYILQNDFILYISYINDRIRKEQSRVQRHMPKSTLAKFEACLLIINNLNTADPFKSKLQEYVMTEIYKEIEQFPQVALESPQVLIKILLEIWGRFDGFVKESFNNDPHILQIFNSSFANAIWNSASEDLNTIISKAIDQIMELLIGNKENELSRMYVFLFSADQLNILMVKLEEHMKDEAVKEIEKDLVKVKDNQGVLIKILSHVWNRFNNLVKNVFNNDPKLAATVDRSFAMIVNENPASYDAKKNESTMPSILSVFCDKILKKGANHISGESELEERLIEAVTKRLIDGSSEDSMGAEVSMINMLKTHQGMEYCTKLTP
eukprot:gene14608-17273_t